MNRKRCAWVGENKPHYEKYHDEEWGVPVHDDPKLFEMLILEVAQAGLNWESILKRRAGYRRAFLNFDPEKVAHMSDGDLEILLHDEGIIRNRLKVFSARANAQIFLEIQKEFGSFDAYLWRFVEGEPIINAWKTVADIPVETPQSKALSKDLKKRGMSFVGPIIMQAYMQAVGLFSDHMVDCWRRGF